MNKILLPLFLFFSLLGLAQGKTHFGIKMGINQAQVQNTNLDSRTGGYAGAFLAIRLADRYTLQPELLYSNQGGKASLRNEQELDIDYISLTIANKFFVGAQRGFHFVVGPGLDFNFEDNLINLMNVHQDALKITPIDLTVLGGIGYEFPFGLGIDLRYKQGLIDLDFSDKGAYGTDLERNQLNSLFQIGLSYTFNK